MRNTTLILLTFFLFLPLAQAAKLIAVKQDKVLILLEGGEQVAVGEKLLVLDANDHKKKALIQISQVKGTRAIGAIVKGTAKINDVAKKLKGSAGAKASSSRASIKSPQAWGLMAGYAMNSMTVNIPGASSVALSGGSFNLKGFYVQELDPAISVKGSAGLETLNAAGTMSTASCTLSTNCTVNIDYLGLDALVRYSFYEKAFRVWAGGGLGFLFALSKSSNVLDQSKISTNETIIGALGVDIPMGPRNFIPLELDYVYWPSNSTTSSHQIIVRAGYGFNF